MITLAVSLSDMPAMQRATILPPYVDMHAAWNRRVLQQDFRRAGDKAPSAYVPPKDSGATRRPDARRTEGQAVRTSGRRVFACPVVLILVVDQWSYN